MDSKLKFLLITISLFQLLNSRTFKKVLSDVKYMTGLSKGVPCNQSIIRSYGLKGYDTSRPMRIQFCPRIRNSCCKPRDQLILYKNWVMGEEQSRLQERLEYYMDVYAELIDLTDVAYKRALKLKKFLDTKKLGNCKILTKRIFDFKPKKLNLKLRAAIMQMYEFFQTSYTGFYCTICDAKFQQYIDVKKEKFNFSKRYCRSILKNTFPVLLYFHNHYLNYVNLITKFLSSCDYKGRFFKTPVPPQFKFHISGENVRLLNKCKVERNKKTWFLKCHKICQKFSPTKMNKFFTPHLHQISKYNKFLKKQIAYLEKEEKMKGFEDLKLPKRKKIKPFIDLFMKYAKPNIFKSSINAVTKVETFKSNFDNNKGINLFFNGSLVNWNEGIYESLKHLEKRSLYNTVVGNSIGNNNFVKVFSMLYISSLFFFIF